MASLSESVGPQSAAQAKQSPPVLGIADAESPRPRRPAYEQLALHPLVLVVSVALMSANLVRFGLGAHGVAGMILLPALVVLSAIDIRHRLLPNRIVLPVTALVLVSQVALASDHGQEAALASVAAGGVFFVLRALYPRGLGMGDVKLALLLGAALGWDVTVGLFVGSLGAAAAGIVVIARDGAAGRKMTLPFGPFLALGAAVAFFLS
jgi:leader peptidase (prepilin peptidase) / N-methyltransferase